MNEQCVMVSMGVVVDTLNTFSMLVNDELLMRKLMDPYRERDKTITKPLALPPTNEQLLITTFNDCLKFSLTLMIPIPFICNETIVTCASVLDISNTYVDFLHLNSLQ